MAKVVKCPKCGEQFDKDKEENIPYKNRYYHVECFEQAFDEEEILKHYFYLTFQDIFNRKPLQLEWIQCQRLIDEGWTWNKLEDVMKYVYTVEGLQETDEYGVVGILPYYELKARKFIDMMWDVKDNGAYETEEGEVVYASQLDLTHLNVKVENNDVDRVWEDDDTWE